MLEPTRIEIKLRVRVLPFLVVLLFGLELLWSTRIWMMLLVAMGGIWLFDFWWARALARGLRLQRELRYDWAQVGDQLEERFTLSKRRLPPALWVEIIDHSTLPDAHVNVATGVDSDSENAWSIKHFCTRRGVFTLGPTTLHSGTPFGLYTIRFEYTAQATLVVMPSGVPLPEIQVAPGGKAKEGRQRTSSFERTVSAVGVREYRPGDPLKTISWRAVAHYDEWMVRTFASMPAGDWWIWLDLDENAQAGKGANSTVEHAVILAASLVERGLREGRAVGLVANAREFVWLAPEHGASQRLELLRALALVEPGMRPLESLLKSTRQAMHANASVIVITPAVEGAWMDELVSWMWNGITPTVLLLDRTTYGGTGSADKITALLAEWGIAHYPISADLFDHVPTRAEQEGQWEWRVSATGRAIARNAPRDQTWRLLK